jgi:uncharacterized protein YqgV (UPF0045/DUF77 family)
MSQTFPVNAALQIIPLRTEDPYPFVDLAIELIRKKGLTFEVGPFSTSVEGSLENLSELMTEIRDAMFEKGLVEFLLNLQIQFHKEKAVSAAEKTLKFR